MAIYHCSVSMISRSSGRSSVGSSAYRSGEKITNEYDGITHDYTNKKGIEYTEIILPQNAPEEFNDRKILWNEVEKSETRINSQTAREVEVALPKELTREEQIYLLKDYVQENFVKLGMCADIAIHDKKDGNPHAHIMLTTREVDLTGFTKKNRDWNNKANLEKWRKSWAEKTNERLLANNIQEKISHLSLEKQGIERKPQIHIGATAAAIEKKGRVSDRAEINREIIKENHKLEQKNIEIQECKLQINEVQSMIEEERQSNIIKKEFSDEEIEKEYFKIKEKVNLDIKANNVLEKIISESKETISDIENSKNLFEKLEERRNKLISDKDSLKLWNLKQKKELELEIEKYSNSIDQVKENFKTKFEIDIKDENSINKFKEDKMGDIKINTLLIKFNEKYIKENEDILNNIELKLGEIPIEKEKIGTNQVEKQSIIDKLKEFEKQTKNMNQNNKRKNKMIRERELER